MEAVKLTNVTKKYKDTIALNNVSLTINEGELFGLLGVNGAGKTTIVKIVSGLCKFDEGSVEVMGLNSCNELSKIKEIVNVSTQETAVAPNLTVFENLCFFNKLYGYKDFDYVNKLIDDFELSDVKNKLAKTLSGGYQRRLSIAISLISHPKVLFLDEPTLGLDVIARHELWDIINSLKGKITIILTSHYLEEIEELAGRVCILVHGNVVACDTCENITSKENAKNFEEAFIKICKGAKYAH